MSFEEEFDRIVRQKAEGAEFPFDEKNWEKASKMLDAERKVVWMGFSAKAYVMILLFLCLGTAGYFLVMGSDAKEADTSVALNVKQTISETSVIRSEENTEVAKSEIAIKGPNEKTIQYLSNTENTIAEANTKANDKTVLTTESAKTENKITSSDFASSSLKKTAKANTSSNSTEETKRVSKPVIAVLPSQSTGSANNSFTEKTTVADNMASAKSGITTNVNDQYNSTKSDFEVNERVVSENEQLEIGSLTVLIPKSEPAAEPEIALAAINVLDYFDEDYYTPENYKKHYLDVEAGGAYLLGWKANSETDGRGFNWYAGVNYGFYVTKKASLSVGVQGYNISNIGKPFFNHTKTEYGFTSSSTQTMITAKSLYYVALPLKMAYSINPQSQIGVGCNVGLLVSSRNVMDTYFYQSDVRTDKTSVNTKGFYDGMNTTNIQWSVFYKTKLTNRLHVNAEALYAPSDIYRYTHSSISTANNFGFRLGLQYTLLER